MVMPPSMYRPQDVFIPRDTQELFVPPHRRDVATWPEIIAYVGETIIVWLMVAVIVGVFS